MPLAPLGRPPRLVLRFALYTGAVLLAAGLAILWTVTAVTSMSGLGPSLKRQGLDAEARMTSSED